MTNSNIKAYADGAAEPTNPGPMGAGYVLKDYAGNILEAKGFHCGHGTNNEAEYLAVGKAVRACVDLGASRVDIFSDSRLAVNQLNGTWRVKADHLRAYRDRILKLLEQVEHWSITWIPREKNTEADALANAAALKKECVTS